MLKTTHTRTFGKRLQLPARAYLHDSSDAFVKTRIDCTATMSRHIRIMVLRWLVRNSERLRADIKIKHHFKPPMTTPNKIARKTLRLFTFFFYHVTQSRAEAVLYLSYPETALPCCLYSYFLLKAH